MIQTNTIARGAYRFNSRAKILILFESPKNSSISQSRKKLLNDAEAIKELARQEEQFLPPLISGYGGGGRFGGGGGGGGGGFF